MSSVVLDPATPLVVFRAAAPADAPAARTFLEGLSDRSRYQRFGTAGPNVTAAVELFTCPSASRGAVIGEDLWGRPVAFAQWVGLPDPQAGLYMVELAVVVADDRRRCGLGARSLDAAILDACRRGGACRFLLEVAASNTAMLRLAQRRFATVCTQADGPWVRLWCEDPHVCAQPGRPVSGVDGRR